MTITSIQNDEVSSTKNLNNSPEITSEPVQSKTFFGRKIEPIIHSLVSSRLVKAALIIGLIAATATVATIIGQTACNETSKASYLPSEAPTWSCPQPSGSYVDTCKITKNVPYRSSDPHLANIQFCQYGIECKDYYNKFFRITNKTLPKEELACAKLWENCHGYLITRETQTNFCQTPNGTLQALKNLGLIRSNATHL